MKDLHNEIKISNAISPAINTNSDTALVSNIIDTTGYESLEFAIITGTLSDANATFTVLVEDGAVSTLSDNAEVADAYLIGTESGASFTYAHDDGVRKIGYIGPKRYVRLTITPNGNNSGNAPIAAIAIQGHPRLSPQSSQS